MDVVVSYLLFNCPSRGVGFQAAIFAAAALFTVFFYNHMPDIAYSSVTFRIMIAGNIKYSIITAGNITNPFIPLNYIDHRSFFVVVAFAEVKRIQMRA